MQAHLAGADLSEANLEGAEGLTQEQIEQASGGAKTGFLCARRFQSLPRLGKSLYRGNGLPGKLVYWLIHVPWFDHPPLEGDLHPPAKRVLPRGGTKCGVESPEAQQLQTGNFVSH